MKTAITASLVAVALCACDDGRIYEETVSTGVEGRVVVMSGELSGVDTWTSNYSIVVAGFDDDSQYAIITKNAASTDGTVSVTLAGISDEVTQIELCAINTIRKRVATFATTAIDASDDTLRFDVGTVDVSMLEGIQQDIFNTTCVACHGGSNYAAAGLYLTEGLSYSALVGQPATRVDNATLVVPGSSDDSFLYQLLSNTTLTGSPYDRHLGMVTENVKLQLLADWIDGLDADTAAENN